MRSLRTFRLLWTLLIAALGAVVGVTVTASPASAHAILLESSPLDNEVLDGAPDAARLRFNEPVTVAPDGLMLLDYSGERIAAGEPSRIDGQGNTLLLPLPDGLKDGTYVIAWRVTSADGHVVSGAFQFSVGEPSAVVVSIGDQRGDRAVGALQAVGRGLAFFGMALAVGGSVLLIYIWPAGRRDLLSCSALVTGFASLGIGSTLVLLTQGLMVGGRPLADIASIEPLRQTLQTTLGTALLARLGLTLLLALVVVVLLRGARSRLWLLLAGALALVLPLTWTLTDHSRTGLQPWLALPATSLHLLAMAAWFGGLAVLVVGVVRPAAGPREGLAAALSRFSCLALACWTMIAATGLYLSWRQVGTPGALPYTDYGRWLLAKLAIVAVIISLANVARRHVAGNRRGEPPPLSRLRVSVGTEAVLGVGVIAVTAILVNSAPARTAYTPVVDKTVVLPDEAQQLLRLDNAAVRLKVTPARTGANVFDVYLKASASERKLFRVAEVTGRLDAANSKVQSLPVTITQAEPGHYVATAVSIPFPGRWFLRLDLRVSEFDEVPLSIPFKVR